jgi:Na+-translocating ferredoxin:NAD+ oxidoreductase RNF subunit RnfB
MRAKLLRSLEIEEYFADGDIIIDERACKGVECQLCVKACPTSALFWKAGKIGIIKGLCIYCGACVLSCIVDNCISIRRTRVSGEVESFSKPMEYLRLQHRINMRKRSQKIREVFPTSKDYLKRSKLKPMRKTRKRRRL